MSDIIPVVVCLKWGPGYPVLYTNVLYRALRERMERPFRFLCITDEAEGLDDGIETCPLPDFVLDPAHWVPGMWPKLSVFKPGLIADGTPVLLMDVDVVIMRDPGALVDRVVETGGLHIIHDWADTLERWFPRWFWKDRGSNSSVVGFIAGEQSQIWEAFRDQTTAEVPEAINDQEFIHAHALDRHYWPAEWVLSFKKSLTWHMPVNFVRAVPEPHEAYVVAFHGKPDPEEVSGKAFQRWGTPEKFGYFPVKWVKRYWDRYVTPSPKTGP